MLPIFDRLMKMDPPVTRNSGISAIIVLPTRELVLQSYEAAVKLTRAATNIVACALRAGESRKSEKARLRKGANIILRTPGKSYCNFITKRFSVNQFVRNRFRLIEPRTFRFEKNHSEKNETDLLTYQYHFGNFSKRNRFILTTSGKQRNWDTLVRS